MTDYNYVVCVISDTLPAYNWNSTSPIRYWSTEASRRLRRKIFCRKFPDPYRRAASANAERKLRGYKGRGKSRLPYFRQFLRCGWLLTDDDDSMSLQWYSPAEAAVADLVRGHSGITPTKWECFEALDRNRDGSYLDAADELLWKYAVERQQLDALSPTERAVAAIVRDKTGDVPTQAECGFYLQLHNDNIQNAATGVRN